MSDDVDLTTRVRILEAELLAVRRALLRAVAIAVAVVIAVGLLLPVYTVDRDDEALGFRTLTIWYSALAEDELDGESVAIVIGFTGLAVCLLGMIWVLLVQVVGAAASRSTDWLRSTLAVLSLIGSTVACLFSLLSLDTDDGSGGWGGVVMLLGAVGASFIVFREGPRELWVTRR